MKKLSKRSEACKYLLSLRLEVNESVIEWKQDRVYMTYTIYTKYDI